MSSRKREEKNTSPWGGRFQESLDKKAEAFTASLSFDRRLVAEDIQGSKIHCRMLVKTGIISTQEGDLILKGLEEIEQELSRGEFTPDPALEDIHMNIEKKLIDKIGPVGGKLHTGRSRNDQVALDMHLFVKREIIEVEKLLHALQKTILTVARAQREVIMPGYTHLQRAQPVLFSHHLLAYFWMLQRDRERFIDSYQRADLMPLGAGAISGTSFPIDREYLCSELDFKKMYENSMDAVSDRDFVLEFLSDSAFLMMHLSRLSEELVLWSSQEFSFVELGDAFSTGSSMMPQKKNPDVPELVRAKTGRVYGNLLSLLTVLKGLPLTYNKDMQEDKEPLFDTVDTVKDVLSLYNELLRDIKLHKDKLQNAVKGDYATATELADYLALRGVPFREAHHTVGKLVRYCLDREMWLTELSPEEAGAFHPLLGEAEALENIKPEEAIKGKNSRGGTSPQALEKQMDRAVRVLEYRLQK